MGAIMAERVEDPLADETNRRILLLMTKQELTGPAIAYMLHLPLADAYLRVARLVRAGYLVVAGYVVSPRNLAHKVYRAKLDGVEVFWSRDHLQMRVPKRGAGVEGLSIEVVVPPKPKDEK
jgi:hypothetical protein